jgi:S1-C subfamily serine protease
MSTTFTATDIAHAVSGELARLTERVRAGVVQVRNGQGGGAGTVVRSDGLIVTNHHVVPGERAHVTTADGTTREGRVVASLPDRDLAVLQVDLQGLPTLPLGASRALRPGDLVLAVGHPLGVTGAASLGVFSSIGPIEARRGRHFEEAVMAAVELRPGNSGGPLVNVRGEVVGINAMVLGPHTAFAVPVEVVKRLIEAGAGPRRTLGVQVQPVQLPTALVQRHALAHDSALLIAGVVERSAAERAGLLPGDILLALNGQELIEPGDLAWALTGLPEGISLTLRLLRGGEPRDITIG